MNVHYVLCVCNILLYKSWNAPNYKNTNIFKVYEAFEESTVEEILVTPAQKTKPKVAKGI